MWEVKEGIELEHCNLWGWCQNNGPIGGLLTMKEFFGLDHFWGKNNFFEKNFVVEWFWRRDWARAFKLGGMIRYIWGSGLLKKNSRFSDFCENNGHFSKIGLYNFFFKFSIWYQHDQFMHHSTGPIYWLLTLKEFFRLGHFLGEKQLFLKINFVMREVKEGIELEHCNLWGWCKNNGPTRGLLTLKEFFGLDHFGGKIAFLKKTLSWVDFKEGIELKPSNLEGWSDIFEAPDYWRKIHGLVILVKIMAVFQKI